MDSNSNMVISAGRALYLRGNNTIRMTIANNVALNCLLLMGTNRISDLAAPQVDSDATNKKYVDDKQAELTASNLNDNNIFGLPTTLTGINDNSTAVTWGALLETLTAMDANLVRKAGDTMIKV
jgi:hypothetical protein